MGYKEDCINSSINELPDLVSWCETGVFRPAPCRINHVITSDIQIFNIVVFTSAPSIQSDITSDIGAANVTELLLTSASDSDGGIYGAGAEFYIDYPPSSRSTKLGKTNGPGWSFFYFRSVQVPQGATVTSAIITFAAADYTNNDACEVDIAIDQDSAPTIPISTIDLQGRWVGQDTTRWDIEPFVIGIRYESPDIANLIQQIISLPGWAAGGNINILAKTIGGDNYNHRNIHSSSDWNEPFATERTKIDIVYE